MYLKVEYCFCLYSVQSRNDQTEHRTHKMQAIKQTNKELFWIFFFLVINEKIANCSLLKYKSV